MYVVHIVMPINIMLLVIFCWKRASRLRDAVDNSATVTRVHPHVLSLEMGGRLRLVEKVVTALTHVAQLVWTFTVLGYVTTYTVDGSNPLMVVSDTTGHLYKHTEPHVM